MIDFIIVRIDYFSFVSFLFSHSQNWEKTHEALLTEERLNHFTMLRTGDPSMAKSPPIFIVPKKPTAPVPSQRQGTDFPIEYFVLTVSKHE